MVELYKKEGKGVVSAFMRCIYVGSKNKRYIKQKGEYVRIVKRKGEYVISNDKKTRGGSEEEEQKNIFLFKSFFSKNSNISKKEIKLAKEASFSDEQADLFLEKYYNLHKMLPEKIAFLIFLHDSNIILSLKLGLEKYKLYIKYKYEIIKNKLINDFNYKQQLKSEKIANEKKKLFENQKISELYLNDSI